MPDYPHYAFPKVLWAADGEHAALDVSCRVVLSYLIVLKGYAQHREQPQVDNNGVLYVICTQDTVCKLLHCGKEKAGIVLKKLEDAGYIRRVHQGLGLADRIYVKELDLGTCTPRGKADHIHVPSPEKLRKDLMNQVHFDVLAADYDPHWVKTILNILVTHLQIKDEVVQIAKHSYGIDYYRARLLSVQEDNMRYVLHSLCMLESAPHSPSAYILARLWESFDCLILHDHLKTLPPPCAPKDTAASGKLGQAELEAIQRVLRDDPL